MNFSLIMLVMCLFMSRTFTIAIPDNSSANGTSITTIFCTFGGIAVFSLEKNGMDLFGKLKQESCESITPSSSNTFLIAQNQVYIFMNFRNWSEDLKSVSMYV